jgi:hypothetical protein
MASSRVFTVAQSLSAESQRLKADVATFLNFGPCRLGSISTEFGPPAHVRFTPGRRPDRGHSGTSRAAMGATPSRADPNLEAEKGVSLG